jgi:protein-tyrosine phosphatase
MLVCKAYQSGTSGRGPLHGKSMIDLHCHILPDIDDGPATMDEAVAMCRIASDDGIRTIVATPHYRPGWYESAIEQRTSRLRYLQHLLRSERINITILYGAELTISPELPVLLDTEPLLTINGKGKYFLVELPFHKALPNWDSFLLSLIPLGKIPILAHPERNAWLRKEPGNLLAFVRAGGLVQITGGSLLGQEGREVQEFATCLVRNSLVHAIASDAHEAQVRTPLLSEAVKVASSATDHEYASDLVTRYPEMIVAGKDFVHRRSIDSVDLKSFKSSRKWSFFK